MRVPRAGLILGVIGTVKSRDYKLWWSTVKHPSSSPFTYIHREVCSQWQVWDGSWPGELSQTLVLQARIPSLHLCKLSSLSMGFMAREFHEVQWIQDSAQLFPKIRLCQRHSVTDSPTCQKPGESLHWYLYDFTKIASKHPPLHLEDGSKHSGFLWGGFIHSWT